jgi:hypothetical protein
MAEISNPAVAGQEGLVDAEAAGVVGGKQA